MNLTDYQNQFELLKYTYFKPVKFDCLSFTIVW